MLQKLRHILLVYKFVVQREVLHIRSLLPNIRVTPHCMDVREQVNLPLLLATSVADDNH